MSNAYDSTAIIYRVGSVATNAVKAMRQVYNRDKEPFLDADTAAIKAIELILADLPQYSEYADLEAKPLVSSAQPTANPALSKIGDMLAADIAQKAAA